MKLAGIALIVALAISLGVGGKAAQAQTLFGLAHSGPDGLSTLYRINPSTGGFDPVGSDTSFHRCSGMDFDASGTLFATCERGDDTHVLITIDSSTGEGKGEEVGPTGVGTGPLAFIKTVSDISFRNSGGALFAFLKDDPSFRFFPFLATINDDGSAAAIALIASFGFGNGIAFSPEDELFHADEDRLNTLELATGAAMFKAYLDFSGLPNSSDHGCCDNIPRVNAMDFLPGTETLFASVNDRLLQSSGVGERPHKNFLATINTTTGDVTIIGKTVKGLDAIAFAPAVTATPPVKADTLPVKAELGSFKCYEVKRPQGSPKFEEVKMTLNDRFDGSIETRVEKAERVCTPVPDVTSSTAGFTCYKIKYEENQEERHPKFQQLDVVVGDEIYGEGQALTLKKPKVICVPSTIVVP